MSDFLDWINIMLHQDPERFAPAIDRRDIVPEVSLGDSNVLPFPPQPGIELSDLVISELEPTVSNEATVVLGGDGLPVDETSPFYVPGITQAGIDYMARKAAEAAIPALDPNKNLVSIGDYVPPEINLSDDGVKYDFPSLGDDDMANGNGGFWDDLGDIGTDYIRSLILPGTPSLGVPIQPPLGVALPVPQSGGGMVPPGAPPAVACNPSGGPYPVMKMVCGQYKWVYPKRKRRRALLTESDYNALLRVQNLKVNQNMTVAIAKALTR